MECKEDGQEEQLPSTVSRRKIERKRRAGEEGLLQLAFTTSVPYSFPTQPMHINQVCNHPTNLPATVTHPKDSHPFMNNMDEISYWVFTKRAPCLLNYDNLMKRQDELAHCSQPAPRSIPSAEKAAPNKKRKIEILDDSISSEKQQNVFFETPQKPNDKTGKKSCRSGSQGSNIDFKIRNYTIQSKPKPKKGKTPQKKTKAITSTPKAPNLRRSLRKTQQNHSHLHSSIESYDNGIINGNRDSTQLKHNENNNKEHVIDEKNEVLLNGKFEDLSDVSGFTANYIRSTKIRSSKITPKSRNKSKILGKDAKDNTERLIMCVNRSMNTGVPKAVLNCSTDSSQNIINLVTVRNDESSNRVDKSTSLLKFMDVKCDKEVHKTRRRNNLNVSFQSKSSGASRYPKRRNISNSKDNSKTQLNSDQIENADKCISKTRSGRKIGLDSDLDTGCSVLQINSTEVSTSVALNLGKISDKKKSRTMTKCPRKKRNRKQQQRDSQSEKSDIKLINESHNLVKRLTRSSGRSKTTDNRPSQRDSLRDKSGFAACFSDNDSDDEPLKQRKFFC